MATLESVLNCECVRIVWVPRVRFRVRFESWTDYERRGRREKGWIAYVVHVVMGPDDGVDRRQWHGCGIQNVGHVGGNVDGYTGILRLFND